MTLKNEAVYDVSLSSLDNASLLCTVGAHYEAQTLIPMYL